MPRSIESRPTRTLRRLALDLPHGLATLAAVGAALACAIPAGVAVAAATDPEFALTLREHRFVPGELTIPAGTRVRIVVDNQDPTPEEFDSHALNREKVIPGRSKATIYVGPLSAGRYEFMGEFNANTARGALIAK